jgi:membrane-associated phospholipid phosphatase
MKNFLTSIKSLFRIEELGFFIFFFLILLSFFNLSQENLNLWDLEKLVLFFTLLMTVLVISVSNPTLKIIRDWLPILFFLSIFLNLHSLIDFLNSNDYDQALIKVDQLIFGIQPSVWLEKFIWTPLTDFLSICYSLFYFYPLPLAVILYLRKGKYRDFRNYAISIILCFYLGFLGYILVPALGPRFTLQYEQELKGSFFSENLRCMLDQMELTKRDVFPSLHNALTLLVLLFAFKYEKKIFYPFLPLALGLFLSTIYLRYHYGIDVICGWILGLICFRLGADLNRWWKID